MVDVGRAIHIPEPFAGEVVLHVRLRQIKRLIGDNCVELRERVPLLSIEI